MKKLFSALVIPAVLAAFLCGCGKKYEEVSASTAQTEDKEETTRTEIVLETETKAEEAATEPVERIEVAGKIRSYLTGEMTEVEKADRRPVAVMMSNDKQALPQYGINRAGVVYEVPVEGGMNRFLAFIEDYDDLERIGSVRSCRTYYTYLAREYDAVYMHYGQSTFAKSYLKNVDNINGLDAIGASAYYRTSDRKSPHNAYTSAGRIRQSIEKLGYRTGYDASYEGHFQFMYGDEQYVPDSSDAYKVVPGYPMNSPWFEYQESEGVYHRFQYGSHHKGDEGLIAVKNIIFQYVEYGHYASTEYLNINLHTGREGYYFTNGKYEKLTWKKDGEFGVTHYYGPDGKEIRLNKGKTWVCIIGTDSYNKAEIYGK
ncbi:MAG: DUF3048 domain-containing protein [Lachnospiraceae bacterium]|nr:DUF3048 domain-containing protein [Lachnospiraceae bacterium]